MGRPCTICASIDKTRIAAEMIAAGASDQAIADRLGGMSRMAVHRHRHSHVVVPAPALAAAAARACVAQVPPSSRPAAVVGPVANRPAPAALASPPSTPASPSPDAQDIVNAALGAPRQAEKLVRIEDRLERMATLAEQSGSPGQVATIATAQLRAVETGAKLAGVGGFAPQKVQGDGGGGGPPCMVTIVIGGQEPIRIAATPLLNMTALPPDSAMSDGAEGAAVVENTGAPPSADDFARLCAAFNSDRGCHDTPAPQTVPASAASVGDDDEAMAAAARPPGWGRTAFERVMREGIASPSGGDPREMLGRS